VAVKDWNGVDGSVPQWRGSRGEDGTELRGMERKDESWQQWSGEERIGVDGKGKADSDCR